MDIMRREPVRMLTEQEELDMATVKETGEYFWKQLDSLPVSREMALAKTKVEEAVMWASKAITKGAYN